MDAYHHDQRGGEDREEGRDCHDENDPSPFVIPIPWPYDAPRAGLVPAEVLGHASIAMTKDVYGHLVEGDKRAAAESISGAPVRKRTRGSQGDRSSRPGPDKGL